MSSERAARFPVGAAVTLADLQDDPHATIAALRREEPVSWIPALEGWFVTSRDLAVEVMRAAESFTVDDPRFSTAQVIGPSMLSLDGIEHRRHREPFVDPFRSVEVQRRFAEWTAAKAGELLGDLAARGEADLRSAFAAPLAVAVVQRALGLWGVGEAEVLGWYDAIVAAVDEVTAGNPVPESGVDAFRELHGAVSASLESSPDSLLASVHAEGSLSVDEVVSNAAVVLFGGIVTSEGTTAAALSHLLGDEDQAALVRADRSLLANAVEETLRLEPAAAVVDRYTTHDVELGGVEIERSELVRVSLAGANRDPKVFSDPDRFDVQRGNANQHVAFARGPHVCLGIHLARLETRIAVDTALTFLPGLRLDAARSSPPRGLIFRAPDAVWATWQVH
jgi:cytochrome P450